MQTVISAIAFTFLDDATALATGFKRVTLELAAGLIAAARARITAPVDRIARACDVAGTLSGDRPARHGHRVPRPTRMATRAIRAPRGRAGRLDLFGVVARLRSLRDLT